MTLQKWINQRVIRGYPTFSVEDVRETGMYSSEQIIKNELLRLSAKKIIVHVYRGFYVIIPNHYVLRGSVPATYYIDQLMNYLGKSYYVCMLSAAELLGAAHQRPQQYSVMTTFPKSRISNRNLTINWFFREQIPNGALITKNTETGTIHISNPLLTAADLVQYQQHVGGLSRVATILEELAEQIDVKSQFAPLASLVKKVVWQRLGYMFENIAVKKELADELYEQLSALPGTVMYKPLSTSVKNIATERDTRWKININTHIETDDL